VNPEKMTTRSTTMAEARLAPGLIRPRPVALERSLPRAIPRPSVPHHVGVMFGLTAAGYAATLGVVSALQASAEGDLIAQRQPVAAAIEQVAADNDRLAGAIDMAASDITDAVAAYEAAAARLPAVEGRLGDLSALVEAVDGAARALPARAPVPTVVRTTTAAPRPVAHATSGGSGAP
jgi:hypothetical protein